MNIWKITYLDDEGKIQEMEVRPDKELEEKLEAFIKEKKENEKEGRCGENRGADFASVLALMICGFAGETRTPRGDLPLMLVKV